MNVYFFCTPPGPSDNTGYEHQLIALAEGFKQLGITFHGNINYWNQVSPGEDFLIHHRPFDPAEVNLVILSSMYPLYQGIQDLPKELFKRGRQFRLIFLDAADGFNTPGFSTPFIDSDFVLKSHYNKKYKYTDNFFSWQFGLTNRLIDYARPWSFDERLDKTIVSTRVEHPVRKLVSKLIIPEIGAHFKIDETKEDFKMDTLDGLDYLYWKQTGRRHFPSYFKRLSSSKLSAAFGGYFDNQIGGYNNGFMKDLVRKASNKFRLLPFDRVFQFDSWRFWESLIAGCCTIHLDFEKYGMTLPVNPIAGEHYIGFDLDNIEHGIQILLQEDRLKAIANHGREWALENYSPRAVAQRLLTIIGYEK